MLEKCPKVGIREESYEGHLGFKSAVSPLIFPFGEEERKNKTLNLNTDPSGKTIPYQFLLHPLLSAQPDLNPATNGA